MANVKQFGNAARSGQDDGSDLTPVVVEIVGQEVEIRGPGTGQLSYAIMVVASSEDDLHRASQIMNFIASLMDDEDGRYFKKCLLDGSLTLEDVADIFEYVLEEWSARPTRRSSASPRSRPTNGTSSTASPRKKASTRSASRSAGS